jgi:hypothetical protein
MKRFSKRAFALLVLALIFSGCTTLKPNTQLPGPNSAWQPDKPKLAAKKYAKAEVSGVALRKIPGNILVLPSHAGVEVVVYGPQELEGKLGIDVVDEMVNVSSVEGIELGDKKFSELEVHVLVPQGFRLDILHVNNLISEVPLGVVSIAAEYGNLKLANVVDVRAYVSDTSKVEISGISGIMDIWSSGADVELVAKQSPGARLVVRENGNIRLSGIMNGDVLALYEGKGDIDDQSTRAQQ